MPQPADFFEGEGQNDCKLFTLQSILGGWQCPMPGCPLPGGGPDCPALIPAPFVYAV